MLLAWESCGICCGAELGLKSVHVCSIAGWPSAVSGFNFGVEPLEFMAGVVDFELPIDATLLGVGFLGPGRDFRL